MYRTIEDTRVETIKRYTEESGDSFVRAFFNLRTTRQSELEELNARWDNNSLDKDKANGNAGDNTDWFLCHRGHHYCYRL